MTTIQITHRSNHSSKLPHLSIIPLPCLYSAIKLWLCAQLPTLADLSKFQYFPSCSLHIFCLLLCVGVKNPPQFIPQANRLVFTVLWFYLMSHFPPAVTILHPCQHVLRLIKRGCQMVQVTEIHWFWCKQVVVHKQIVPG